MSCSLCWSRSLAGGILKLGMQILLTERKFLKLIHRDSTLKGANMGCFQADFGDCVFGDFTTTVEHVKLSLYFLNYAKAVSPLVGVEGFLPSVDA